MTALYIRLKLKLLQMQGLISTLGELMKDRMRLETEWAGRRDQGATTDEVSLSLQPWKSGSLTAALDGTIPKSHAL